AGLARRFIVDLVLQDAPDARVVRVKDSEAGGARRTLKIVPCALASTADRLAAEFALLEHVRHPNLTAQLEYGRTDDAVWLLRESVEGGTWAAPPDDLDDEAQRGVLVDVLRGLAHLHGRGALHLDVKPENVFLRREGASRWRGVLSDFGFAAAARGEDVEARGTPPFVAPEVVLGQPRDERADLFSLGVTWIVSSGKAPPIDVAALYERFPRRSFVEATGIDLEAVAGRDAPVLARCLATDPDDRPRSAAEVLHAISAREAAPEELEALLAPDPVAVEEVGARWARLIEERRPETSWLDVPSEREADAIVGRLRFLAARAERPLEVVDGPEERDPSAVGMAAAAAREGIVLLLLHGPEDAARVALWLRARDGLPSAPALVVVTVRRAGLDEPAVARLASGVGPPVELAAEGRAALLRQLVRLEGRPEEEPPPARLEALASALDDASGGDPEATRERLVRALREGRIRGEDGRFDFSGLDAADVGASETVERRAAALPAAARGALAVLDLFDGGAPREALAFLADDERAAVPELLRDRLLVRGVREGAIRPSSTELARRARATLDPAAWRARSRTLREEVPRRWLSPADRALLLAAAGRDGVLEARSEVPASTRRSAHRLTARYDEILPYLEGDAGAAAELRARRAEHRVRTADLERAAEELDELVVDPALPAARRVALRARAGRVALALSRSEDAERHFDEGRKRAARLSRPLDPHVRVMLERGYAFGRYRRGDIAGALASLEAVRRAPANREALPWLDALVGALAWRAGDKGLARRSLERSRDAARAAGSEDLLATTLQDLVSIDLAEGRVADARRGIDEARALRRRLGHVHEEGTVENLRGLVLRENGNLAGAAEAFAESARLRRRLGDALAAASDANRAHVEALRGSLRAAETELRAAVDELERGGGTVEAQLARIR
ncbi:MAG: protein kinase, partial [Planctomycetota bacterium JB042]